MPELNDAQREAIATADAHLGNAALPTWTAMWCALHYLHQQASLSDLPPTNGALRLAATLTHMKPAGCVLALTDEEAAALHECLQFDVLDLSTINVDEEDRPKVEHLTAILRRLPDAQA